MDQNDVKGLKYQHIVTINVINKATWNLNSRDSTKAIANLRLTDSKSIKCDINARKMIHIGKGMYYEGLPTL